MSKLFAALLLVSGLSFTVHAQDANESSIKASDVTGEKNTTPGQDIDETITNKKMRAETGSKSKWSISSQLNYIGGSIEKPLSEDRPNIAGANGTTDASLIGGQVSGKYNLSSSNSLMAGVGVRWISPFQAKPSGYQGDRVDADNPYLIYQHLYKWKGIQSALQINPVFYTQSNLRAQGWLASVAVAQNNIYEIGHSGVSLGLYLLAQGAVFDKNGADVKPDQSDFVVNFDPFIEYQLTENINLRTVTNLWNYEHARSAPGSTYIFDKVYQSIGVGYAMTRDIYLYPNLQFLPDDIRSDRTNVALNTYINVF